MKTVHVSFELPRNLLSALRKDPAGFVREMRVAAAGKWYENRVISQSKAAEVAGLSRAEFINALNEFMVSAFQYNSDEIISEVTGRRKTRLKRQRPSRSGRHLAGQPG